jgi:MSHA biogenesis protein MshJ
MKALWLKWAARIDALSLRERAMAGAAAVAVVIFVVYMGFIEPAQTQERTLRAAILQQRAQLAGIDVEIAQKQAAAQTDPDAGARKRLAVLRLENDQLRASLRNAQRGLVQPTRMSALLQQMVQQNGRLKLVSLKTLPPAGTTDGRFADGETAGAAPTSAPAAPAGPVLPATPLTTTPPGAAPAAPAPSSAAEEPLLYRHGVRIVLQGAYPDMVGYMRALERLPVQVFWGKATLDATEHDKTTLTLTLYTLSLDEKWIAL